MSELYLKIRDMKCYCPECNETWETFIEIDRETPTQVRCHYCYNQYIDILEISEPYDMLF